MFSISSKKPHGGSVITQFTLLSEIKGSSKVKEIVTPRNIVVYLAREILNMSYSQIGNTLGNRKHATIMYSYDQIKNNKDTNFKLGKELKYISNRIKLGFLS